MEINNPPAPTPVPFSTAASSSTNPSSSFAATTTPSTRRTTHPSEHPASAPLPSIHPSLFVSARRASELDPAALRQGFTAAGVALEAPKGAGKTSLLFQYATNLAERGGRVLLLCENSKLLRDPPAVEGELKSVDETVLRRIALKFVDSGAALVGFLARIQEPDAYDAILVDDLDTWFHHDRAALLRCLCLLSETVAWLHRRKKGAEGGGPLEPPLPPPHFMVAHLPLDVSLKRWVPCTAVATRVEEEEAGAAHGTLHVLRVEHAPESNVWLHSDRNAGELASAEVWYRYASGRVPLTFVQARNRTAAAVAAAAAAAATSSSSPPLQGC